MATSNPIKTTMSGGGGPDEAEPGGWIERADRVAAAAAAEAEAHDGDDSFVAEGYRRLKADGLFKALVPAELGGGGASVDDMARCIRRIGASCGSTALAFAMHSHLVAVAAWRRRHQNAPTEGLVKRVAAEDLVPVSSGGSDWLPSGGTAVKVEGGYRVTARKAFSSGCPAGDLLVTSAVLAMRGMNFGESGSVCPGGGPDPV